MKNEIREQLYNNSKPGMYIIEFENGYKFGIAKNLNKRVHNYNKPWSQPMVSVTLIPMSHEIAANTERSLKWELSNKGLKKVEGSTEFVLKGTFSKEFLLEHINMTQRILEEGV